MVSTLQEDKIELIKKAQAGDKDALNSLVETNIHLVNLVIRKFYWGKESLDDVRQTGVIGLIKAIRRFDIDRNIAFSTYAMPAITSEIHAYYYSNKQVSMPRHTLKLANRIRRAGMIESSLEEIREKLNMHEESEWRILHALTYVRNNGTRIMSLNSVVPGGAEEGVEYIDRLAKDLNGDDWLNHMTNKDEVDKLLVSLDDRAKRVLHYRYKENKSQYATAKLMGVSQPHVCRIEKSALAALRRLAEAAPSDSVEEVIEGMQVDTRPTMKTGKHKEATDLLLQGDMTLTAIAIQTDVSYGVVVRMKRELKKKGLLV